MKTTHLPKIKCSACEGTGKVPDLSAIGRGRREAREAAGVKATPLAAKMGIPKSTLWDLETGRRGQWTDALFDAHVAGVAELAKAKKDKAETKRWQKAGKAARKSGGIPAEKKAKAKKREAATVRKIKNTARPVARRK